MRIGMLQLEKRETVSITRRILNPILFFLLSLAFGGIFIKALGFHPLTVYLKMLSYSFLKWQGIKNSFMAALPLIFCGLSVTVAFKMNLNNIGAEGQYAIGAIFGGAFALYGPDLPLPLRVALMFLLCALGGAFWAFIAAVLKALWNVNETIVTLMLNYIALLFLDFLCYGPWMAKGQTTPMTEKIDEGLYLPNLGSTGINSGILLALVIGSLLFFYFKYTTAGFEAAVIKNSIGSAKYAGIDVKKNILLILSLSGAIAGLAGFVEVTGVVHRIQAQLPSGNGYTGIVIAYLSQFNPIVVILVSILLGGLDNSSSAVQMMGVPSQIAAMLQGCIMIFVIAGEFFNRYKIRFLKTSLLRGGREI